MPELPTNMPELPTKESFAEQLHTKFRVLPSEAGAPEVELELAEVVGFNMLTHEQGEVERFSLFFYGPGDRFLPQHVYRLAHDRLGEQDIFIVPVGRDQRGYRYEAVFSFYKGR